MSPAPKSEWDWLLQSTLRLKPGVGVRFDTRSGYCLHDLGSGRSFGLDPWQTRLLRGIEAEVGFGETVHDVLAHFAATVGRDGIASLVRGLEHHGLLDVHGPRRTLPETADSKRRTPRRWLGRFLPELSRFWIAEAVAFSLVVTGVWTQQFGSATAADPLAQSLPGENELDRPLAWGTESGVPVRVWCRGVISAMLVRDGDQVRAGDILARIADPMAQATCDDLRQQLGESRMMRDQFYRDGELVEYLRESKAMAQLAGILGEWEAKSDSIALRAPVDGRIRHKQVSEGVGNPVQPGDVLMTIDAVEEKPASELVAAMP